MKSNYYVAKNGSQMGPFTLEELKEKVESSAVSFYDLCWCSGMDNWAPIIETLEFGQGEAPPPHPPPPVPKSLPKHSEPSAGKLVADEYKIDWRPAVITQGIALIFFVISDAGNVIGHEGMLLFAAIMGLLVYIAATIFWSFLHYRLWQVVEPHNRVTTPGKALGFMFIPLFNFYWAFITWPKLVKGLRDSGFRLSEDADSHAFALAVLFVCSWTIAYIPFVDSLVGIGSFIAFCLFYIKIGESITKDLQKDVLH